MISEERGLLSGRNRTVHLATVKRSFFAMLKTATPPSRSPPQLEVTQCIRSEANAQLTAIRAAEVVINEDRAEVGGGRLWGGRRVRGGGHRGRRRQLRLRLGDAAEGDLMRGLPLQGDGVALQGAGGRRSHGPDPGGLQWVHGLPGLQDEDTGTIRRPMQRTLFLLQTAHYNLCHSKCLLASSQIVKTAAGKKTMYSGMPGFITKEYPVVRVVKLEKPERILPQVLSLNSLLHHKVKLDNSSFQLRQMIMLTNVSTTQYQSNVCLTNLSFFSFSSLR